MSKPLHLLSPAGFRAAGVAAGIKRSGKLDLGLLLCDGPATAAAVFTQNRVVSPAVVVGRRHVAGGRLRAVVVNSGNANACTGGQGLADAVRMADLTGELLGCGGGEVLPSSTGVIGHLLPMAKIEAGLRAAAGRLGDSADHAAAFADAILTTDLARKTAATSFTLGGETVRIAGVCKGSGMIGPDLALDTPPHATMLAYLTTDADVPAAVLSQLLQTAADGSFNSVTVDGHNSTNDTAAILASGRSGVMVDGNSALETFAAALNEVCQSLAYQIAADGEGATKVVVIKLTGAATDADARRMARAVADSPLVKCAMHGNDPNWGRIVSAAGMAGVAFDADRCELTLAGTKVFRHGVPLPFDAEAASKSLDAKEVTAHLACGLGDGTATVWTCDLSREYVTINADYHT